MKDNNTVRSGINFFELLGIVFIILRLCGVIDWPWVWVLAPIWVPIGLWLLAVLIAFIVAARKRR
jgi:hypothetical protein